MPRRAKKWNDRNRCKRCSAMRSLGVEPTIAPHNDDPVRSEPFVRYAIYPNPYRCRDQIPNPFFSTEYSL
jgi:hypothetical protein